MRSVRKEQVEVRIGKGRGLGQRGEKRDAGVGGGGEEGGRGGGGWGRLKGGGGLRREERVRIDTTSTAAREVCSRRSRQVPEGQSEFQKVTVM